MRDELDKLNLEVENAEARLKELKNRVLMLKSPESKNEESFTSPKKESIDNYKAQLEEKNKLIQKTEEFYNVGRWSYDFDTRKLEWSEETYKIFELPTSFSGDLMKYYHSCADENSKARFAEHSKLMRSSKEDLVINQTIVTPLGTKKLLTFSSSPILNKAGEITGADGFVRDLSDKLLYSHALDSFFNLSYDLHCIAHPDLYFVKISPAWSKLLGYSEKEILSRSFMEFLHPDDINDTKEVIEVLHEKGSLFQFENRYITKAGEEVHLSWNSQTDPESQLTYCNVTDVTKSKLDKEALLSDLSTKELLLREIHHRVKNNLQIITSLLSLQAGAHSEKKHLIKLYEDSRNRIQSMAAIHEMFYQSEELDKIEVGKYLKKLIGDLSKSFGIHKNTVDFTLEAESVFVNLDTAIPLGLVINEIVTNSIKYGVDHEGNVKITVSIEAFEGNKVLITIGDDGVNSLDNVLNQKVESLGVLLINSLVEQIDGEIKQISESDGTVFKLAFVNKLEMKI